MYEDFPVSFDYKWPLIKSNLWDKKYKRKWIKIGTSPINFRSWML